MWAFVRAAALAASLASIAGCGKIEKMMHRSTVSIGGGCRSIAAGKSPKEAVYGSQAGQLAFVVFTDIQADGTTASGGSNWEGQIAPAKGMAVSYAAIGGGLAINGTDYKFASGRVFLVSTKADKLSVTQLDVPVGNGDCHSEMDRLAKTKEVQEFLGK